MFRVTSYTRGALLLGSFSAYSIAQLIILLEWGTYQTLNIISLAALCISFCFAVALPNVSWKDAFEKKKFLRDPTKLPDDEIRYKKYVKFHFSSLVEDVKVIYGNMFMLKWSVWWALASCAYFQVGNYIQTLWGTRTDLRNSDIYNGLTEALCPLVSLPAVLLVQHLRVNWSRWGELCLASCSLLNALILFWLSQTNSLIVMYAGYIVYRLIYETMITITQSNLAEGLEMASYGLVFGINTFIALVMQSILTLVVNSALKLSIKPQFVVYSGFHFAVAAIFIVPLLFRVLLHPWRRLRGNGENAGRDTLSHTSTHM
ncbi:unnamed protein product [Heligmosomoides polygyrus]|uniref:Reduced folate carrier n=1 Tax=Heligmosomoides polygyrus TaxID=6339 RepID=A0A183FWT1_HELPZ|nr:unnamed protein product [Heligmosomoides polygyrus]